MRTMQGTTKSPRSRVLLQMVRGRLSPRDLDCLAVASREVEPELYAAVVARLRQRLRKDRFEPLAP